NGRAHRGKVDEQRHAGEILQDNSSDHERNFFRSWCVRFPASKGADVLFGNAFAVAVAQDGFQHQTDGYWQFGDWTDTGFFQLGQRIKSALLAISEVELL